MTERKEIKLKGELYKILLREIPQKPTELPDQRIVRILNLTQEIYRILDKNTEADGRSINKTR